MGGDRGQPQAHRNAPGPLGPHRGLRYAGLHPPNGCTAAGTVDGCNDACCVFKYVFGARCVLGCRILEVRGHQGTLTLTLTLTPT